MIRLALRSHGATGQKFWCFIGSIRLRYSEVDFYGFHRTGATRCTDEGWTWREKVDGWLHAKSLSDDSRPLIIENNVTLERYNSWPHVTNRHISTSQLLPLWHHSHYDAAPIPIMTSFSLWHLAPTALAAPVLTITSFSLLRHWRHAHRYGRRPTYR